MNNLRITTAELARLCSVSQGTVDRALNNRSGIKAETKERILKTAAQYGFRGAVGNSKYRITISSVAYSIEEIAGKALDCIVNKSCGSQTIAHYFVKRV